jgi:hypothetical protein
MGKEWYHYNTSGRYCNNAHVVETYYIRETSILETLHFALNEIMKASDIFGNVANEKALKVMNTNE